MTWGIALVVVISVGALAYVARNASHALAQLKRELDEL